QHVKEDSNLLVVWALGAYSVEREDYDIELILFVPIDLNDRDFESQAVFEKDRFFSVGGKIVPGYYGNNKRAKMTVSTSTHVTILNKVSEANKCPLKISLIGIPQDKPNEIKEDIVVNILITDYVGQECNFIVKAVFPCYNLRFMHLKDTIKPLESLVFLVGQMEIINNNFYVYVKDINYVDTYFAEKRKFLDSNAVQDSSMSQTSIRSKLLVTHKNISENSKGRLESGTLPSVSSCDFENKSELNLSDCSHSSKHGQTDDFNKCTEEGLGNIEHKEGGSCAIESNDSIDTVVEEDAGGLAKKRVLRNKGKEHVNRSLRSNLRSQNSNEYISEEEE
ncbi:12966_t:CDS:2, partial [Cetraspora pellucida]